jgi:Bacterial regulatory protein, arsR family
MLELLRDGELRVTEIAEPFDISLAAASKHVRVLESAEPGRKEDLRAGSHPVLRTPPADSGQRLDQREPFLLGGSPRRPGH